MCGISGIINKSDEPVDEQTIRRITDLVAHRGPDDSGIYGHRNLAFGHRRLSILDLSPRGHQPMTFRGRYVITYNGEIYNYLELRSELEKRGARFETATDTEVVLAAFAHWGPACLTRFNGMWAFAIHDREEGTVFLSRDRFGVKPLYYIEDGKRFAFGSEIKQLLALQPVARANQRVVVEWLLTSMEGHTEETFFAGVYALPQAHYLIYRLSTNSHTLHRYWDLRPDDTLKQMSAERAVETVGELLGDAVRLRLRSDVTVGTCLSGGLDSSAITAWAAPAFQAATGRRFTAIHAKSIEKRSDESGYARAVAAHLDIDLFTVEPSTRDFVETIDELVITQEEPFGSPSMFMGWHVFREAKARGCSVMLNGQGGDEVFLGYERYLAAFLKSVPLFNLGKQLLATALHSGLPVSLILQYYFYFTNPEVRIWRLKARSRLKPHVKSGHDFSWVRKSVQSFSSIGALQVFELCTLVLPHLLRFEDRNSMRHSVETRLPFLDYRLVEAAVSLPERYQMLGGWRKYLLRKAVEGRLPANITWRKDKLGFEAPEATWLGAAEGDLRKEVSRSRILAEIADRAGIVRDFSRLPLRQRWAYFNIAAWERIFRVSWD